MSNEELGEHRWQILHGPKCWLKVAEMITALLTIVLSVSFDQTATVHMKNQNIHYDIMLEFPFIFKENVTVKSPAGLKISPFKFEPPLLPSAIIFVTVAAIALVAAIAILSFYIVQYGSQAEQSYITWDFITELVISFLIVASTSFWLSSFVSLKNNVSDQVEFLMGQCGGRCVHRLPNYITLYFSTAFAIILSLLWLTDCVLIYIRMVHTIPQQITQNLVQNVEMSSAQH